MTVVAIHQPNYAPWLGYFHKLARADIFVFLDDVQFTKQSYINRVKILGGSGARWLTLPVSVHLGDTIGQVCPARQDWVRSHLDTLHGAYGRAPAFKSVWPEVRDIYLSVPYGSLAEINRSLIVALAARLGIEVDHRLSSECRTDGLNGDDRLVAIVSELAPGGAYLSGRGGAHYQDADKFAGAGLSLQYTNFDHPAYAQSPVQVDQAFVAGLSVLDAVFHLGWVGAAALIHP